MPRGVCVVVAAVVVSETGWGLGESCGRIPGTRRVRDDDVSTMSGVWASFLTLVDRDNLGARARALLIYRSQI